MKAGAISCRFFFALQSLPKEINSLKLSLYLQLTYYNHLNSNSMKTGRILMSFLITLMCVGFTSCGDDDDDLEKEQARMKEALVGHWLTTDEQGWSVRDGGAKKPFHLSDSLIAATSEVTVIKEDGSGYTFTSDAASYDDFEWQLSGKSLTLVGEKMGTYKYTVKSVNETTLKLEMYIKEDDDEIFLTLTATRMTDTEAIR